MSKTERRSEKRPATVMKVQKSSASQKSKHRRFVVVGPGAAIQKIKQATVCQSKASMRKAIEESTRDSVWISTKSQRTEQLLEVVSTYPGISRRFRSLVMLEPPRPEILPSLHGYFGEVIGEVPSFKMLPSDELAEVMSASTDAARDVFIGGNVDLKTETLALVRGNLERLTVPLSIFRPSGKSSPDFKRFSLGDYGHTLRFGDYEATTDVVLWESDPEYRKRKKVKERAHAKGFGPSLRRLRKQRGLSQSDFPGVSRKTIARIENGEIESPHGTTLSRVAKTLGVAPEEIETY